MIQTARLHERRSSSIAKLVADRGLGISLLLGASFAYLTSDWVVLPGMFLLWAFWKFLPSGDAPPGLPFSFSYHLIQIIAGVFYYGITQRTLVPHAAPQYHYMMVIAVGSLAAVFVGFLIGDTFLRKQRSPVQRLTFATSFTQLFLAYLVALGSADLVFILQARFPALEQPLYALGAVQLGLLYLVLRRLFVENRLWLVFLLIAFETARGFTGFYSGFKEPVILGIVAAVEILRPRRVGHWAVIAGLVFTVFFTSVLWLGIRGAIREDMENNQRTAMERFLFATREMGFWWERDRDYKMYDTDALVSRVWDIYYTALALDRVPSAIPHQNGTILGAAVQHVLMPRFLFPDKPPLPSESDDVRRYTHQQVAGREQGTTIAFGYVIQAYIDFGIPYMFLPAIGLGLFLGLAYRWFLTQLHFEEILFAVLAVAFWANIMPYNMSWAKMMGKMLTSMIYVGGAAALLDHFLYTSRMRHAGSPTPVAYAPPSRQ